MVIILGVFYWAVSAVKTHAEIFITEDSHQIFHDEETGSKNEKPYNSTDVEMR